MPESSTFENTSSARLHDARVAMCELLYDCGFMDTEWFWYAELVTYSDSEEWWPLLSARYRKDDGQTQETVINYVRQGGQNGEIKQPDFYKRYYEATIEGNVLSVITAVKDQFASAKSGISPLPAFAFFDASDSLADARLQCTLIERAEAIERLLAGRYQIIPSKEHVEEMQGAKPGEISQATRHYVNYVNNVMKLPLALGQEEQAYLYPKSAWVCAIPIYDMRNGRPLLLASFIIIVEAPVAKLDTPEATNRFRAVQRCITTLEVQAAHILSHRFYHDIVGYVPGNDPIVLLAHPNLCSSANLDSLRLVGEWHDFSKYREQFSSKPSLMRAYERSYLDAKKTTKVAALDETRRRVKESLKNTDFGRREEKANEDPAWASYRWLKPMYAHQLSRAHLPYPPSNNTTYDLTWAGLFTLCELIGMMTWSQSKSAAVYVFPPKDREDCRFRWPVEPGVRLLIPWLHTIKSLAETLRANSMKVLLLHETRENWNAKLTVCNDDVESESIKKWLELRNPTKPCPNGLVTTLLCPTDSDPYELERRARGWTRVLINPLRRRGQDTTLFQNLILGDLASAMRERGLGFPEADPLFRPLEGSMPIDIDISASGAELLVGTTWTSRFS